jgi:putative aminopeptidase FrvX
MKRLLKTLTEALGPSGYEDAVRRIVLKEVKPLVDEVRVDRLGNVIAHRRPAKGAKTPRRIMLAAHLDEIGLIASHVDRNGFIRFAPIGEVVEKYALGARVRFLNGTGGVVGHDSPNPTGHSMPFSRMFVDVGVSSREECPVNAGDVAAFEGSFVESGRRLTGKAMDDRAGVAVLIETLRRLKSRLHDVYFVFTTRQAVEVRGAGTAAYSIDPEIGLAVDTTPAGDMPGNANKQIQLGGGPCVKIKDAQMLSDPRLVDWILRAAERGRIPFQREVSVSGNLDARAIQVARGGVAAGGLAIPVRYTHSSSEMVDYDDLRNSVRLLVALLCKPVSF